MKMIMGLLFLISHLSLAMEDKTSPKVSLTDSNGNVMMLKIGESKTLLDITFKYTRNDVLFVTNFEKKSVSIIKLYGGNPEEMITDEFVPYEIEDGSTLQVFDTDISANMIEKYTVQIIKQQGANL